MKVKFLRPFAAFLLCALLVFSLCITASADGKHIEKIELENIEAVTFYENCGGSWERQYNARTKEFETYYHYDFRNMDCPVHVYFSDGTDEVTTTNDLFREEQWNLCIYEGQRTSHWSKDSEENYFLLEYTGGSTLIPVQIEESPVESIELIRLERVDGQDVEIPVRSLTFFENTGGREEHVFDEAAQEEVTYFRYDDFNDLYVKISFSDGSEPYLARSWECVSGLPDTVRFGEDQAQNPWLPEKENILTVEYMGLSITVPVTILDNPVASIEPVAGAAIHLIENAGGRQETYRDEETGVSYPYFRYDVPGNDVQIVIHYKDPSKADKTANLFEWVDGAEVRFRDEQGQNPWLPEKSNNVLTVEYLGLAAEIPVFFDESPVDSVEILDTENNPIRSLTITEYCDGGIDGYHDPETDRDITYFRYDIDGSKIHVLIRYADGTDRIVSPHDDIDGYNVKAGDDQRENPWTKDARNILTVEYMGKTASIPVTITKNPVDRIEIVKGAELHFIQNANGHTERHFNEYNWDWDEYFRYDIEKESVQIRIFYTDETRKPVTAYLYDKIDGYEVKTVDNQPWSPEGDNRLAVEYMGKYAEINVVFDENPVDTIDISGASSYTVIENIDGSYETRRLPDDTEETYFRYNIHHNDFSVKIYYRDGTVYIAEPFETVNGFRIEAGHNQQDDPWLYGKENFMTVEYLGKTVQLPVVVISGDVNNDGETDVLDIIRLTKRIDDGAYERRADVNQDGFVNEDDMTLLREILNQVAPGEEPEPFIPDINEDGQTNVLDMIRIKKLIASGEYHEEADLNHDKILNAEDLALLFQALL